MSVDTKTGELKCNNQFYEFSNFKKRLEKNSWNWIILENFTNFFSKQMFLFCTSVWRVIRGLFTYLLLLYGIDNLKKNSWNWIIPVYLFQFHELFLNKYSDFALCVSRHKRGLFTFFFHMGLTAMSLHYSELCCGTPSS